MRKFLGIIFVFLTFSAFSDDGGGGYSGGVSLNHPKKWTNLTKVPNELYFYDLSKGEESWGSLGAGIFFQKEKYFVPVKNKSLCLNNEDVYEAIVAIPTHQGWELSHIRQSRLSKKQSCNGELCNESELSEFVQNPVQYLDDRQGHVIGFRIRGRLSVQIPNCRE